MLGFLPLYLRDLGWEPAIADSTLASFRELAGEIWLWTPISVLGISCVFRVRGLFLLAATGNREYQQFSSRQLGMRYQKD
jgi:hypothetical protein